MTRSDLIQPHSIHCHPAAALHPVERAALETLHAAASGKSEGPLLHERMSLVV
jgi:hypothetical protein